MLRAILIMLNYSLVFASYAPTATSEEVDAVKDEELVHLAYSNPSYDNVGELYSYRTNHLMGITFSFKNGSATYIGGKICLSAAHCEESPPPKFSLEPVTLHYEVAFEINGQGKKHYKVKKFIPHPQYKQNDHYDLAVLVLEESIKELKGLKISEEFSTTEPHCPDYQHLLTYIGYGVKVSDNGYFLTNDHYRRALRSHTFGYSLEPNDLVIYSTPYGQYNQSKVSRPLIPYEAITRKGMSGGAVLNCNDELASIIYASNALNSPWKKYLCLNYARVIVINIVNIIPGFIDLFFYPTPILNDSPEVFSTGTYKKSVPLVPFKEWIQDIRKQYDDTYLADYV